MFGVNGDNILCIVPNGASSKDFNHAISAFSSAYLVEDDDGLEAAEVEIVFDLFGLSEDQRQELRDYYEFPAIFSDGSGEPGDIEISLSGRIVLTEDRQLIADNFFFLTRDNSDEDDDTTPGIIMPEAQQLVNIITPAILYA